MGSSLPKIILFRKNGLQIAAIPMKMETNVISTDIFYKVGSRNEKMGKSGICPYVRTLKL